MRVGVKNKNLTLDYLFLTFFLCLTATSFSSLTEIKGYLVLNSHLGKIMNGKKLFKNHKTL